MADTGQEIVVAREEAAPPALPTTPMELLSRALERGADLSMVEKLMDLADRHEKNEARRAFDEAIAAAKAEIPVIRKNRHVGFASKKEGGARTDYAYEDLAEIARVVTPILSKHGLSYRFRTHYEPNHPVTVTCIISHRLGYCEENTLPAPPDNSGNKNSIQAIGSTLTYLQRMTLKAALGLAAAEDDDARAGGGDEPISEEQRTALQAKIDEAQTDAAKLCAYLKIDALPDLPKSRLGEAEAMLNERLKVLAAKRKKQEARA